MKVTAITAEFLEHLNSVVADEHTTFRAQAGRRFDKIIACHYSQESVHAFIERDTGDMIKPGTWTAPQQDVGGLAVRFRLADPESMQRAKALADRFGSYLYL